MMMRFALAALPLMLAACQPVQETAPAPDLAQDWKLVGFSEGSLPPRVTMDLREPGRAAGQGGVDAGQPVPEVKIRLSLSMLNRHGLVAAALSVAKLPYEDALDGISLTNTITPTALGRTEQERIDNLVGILDAGMGEGLYHANINVLNKETLLDAMENPENYPQLTIRVSGYAVNFVKLTREQQLDVLSRTFHEAL